MKKHLLLVFVLVVIGASLCKAQNPILWGTTSSGGTNYSGAVFNFNTSTANENVVYECDTPGGIIPSDNPIMASNGLLYGLMTYDVAGNGTIYSYDSSTGTYIDVYHFIPNTGFRPNSKLLQAGNGLLYGTTGQGGAHQGGTIFSFDVQTNTYTDLHDFNIDSGGHGPIGVLLQANDSMLYGVTYFGGTSIASIGTGGTLFSYNLLTGMHVVLHVFGNGNDGLLPIGGLMRAHNGLFYGTTVLGGTDSTGTIFSYSTDSNTYKICHNFTTGNDGKYPNGPLLQAGDGLLYGTAGNGGRPNDEGGVYNQGVIFSFNIATSQYGALYNFANYPSGTVPAGPLIQASDSLLYGTTISGGNDTAAGAGGTIFSYNIANGNVVFVHSFNGTDGASPQAGVFETSRILTGIMEAAANSAQLQISPVPTAGAFTVQLPTATGNCMAGIYNVAGQKIDQVYLTAGQNTLNLNNQPAGMYFITAHTQNGFATGKVIIVK